MACRASIGIYREPADRLEEARATIRYSLVLARRLPCGPGAGGVRRGWPRVPDGRDRSAQRSKLQLYENAPPRRSISGDQGS